MKKRRWAIIAFAVIFAAAYVAMGYCIPAFRIKLEADGWTDFLASLQALAPVKLIFAAGVFAPVPEYPAPNPPERTLGWVELLP